MKGRGWGEYGLRKMCDISHYVGYLIRRAEMDGFAPLLEARETDRNGRARKARLI